MLLKTLQKFWHNEDGAFIAIFGAMGLVLLALSGAVVDYVTVQQARNRAQIALDAAALSLQPSIYTDTDAELLTKAQALLTQQIGDTRIGASITDVQTDETEGSIYFEALLTVPMVFVSFVGFDEMQPVVVSEATRKKIFLEVAFVLDNSGSMGSSSRMTNLKAATENAVDILYAYSDPADGGDGSVSDQTYIGIVPFNFHVNVGTGYENASWMDGIGNSDAAKDNFDDDDDDSNTFSGAVDRFALYDEISNVSWEGCVETRKYPYDTDDTEPDASVPNTLFIPVFAPDEPDSGDYDFDYLDDDPANCQVPGLTRTCEYTQEYSGCNKKYKKCDDYDETYTATYPDSSVQTGSNDSICSCSGETLTSDTGWIYGGSGKNNYTAERTQICNQSYSLVDSLSDRERQERICKYSNTSSSSSSGPNAACISTPILPLTNTRADVLSTITAMDSSGATNIHHGTEWGFHMLSPTEPLTEGRGYDTAVSKVAIIMTDGQNTFYQSNNDSTDLNGDDYYPAYSHPYNQRLGTMASDEDDMADLMNTRLSETCENMKGAGINVYTIGLEAPSTVQTMLTDCASESGQAYFPTTASELTSVFESIANQLADLRLAQ